MRNLLPVRYITGEAVRVEFYQYWNLKKLIEFWCWVYMLTYLYKNAIIIYRNSLTNLLHGLFFKTLPKTYSTSPLQNPRRGSLCIYLQCEISSDNHHTLASAVVLDGVSRRAKTPVLGKSINSDIIFFPERPTFLTSKLIIWVTSTYCHPKAMFFALSLFNTFHYLLSEKGLIILKLRWELVDHLQPYTNCSTWITIIAQFDL